MVADAVAPPKRQRILIVEDEPFIALALEAMLLELGFDVAGTAAQVSAALQLIEFLREFRAVRDTHRFLEFEDRPVRVAFAGVNAPG